MLNLTYLAVLEPGEDGSYSISFPDLPGCFSYGDNLAEAQRMAKEAASLHVYGMERDGDEIPTPSLNLPRENTGGNVVMPVTIHPDLYRAKRDNERVKTNITLPPVHKQSQRSRLAYNRISGCQHGSPRDKPCAFLTLIEENTVKNAVYALLSLPNTSVILCLTNALIFARPSFKYALGSNAAGSLTSTFRMPAVKARRKSESILILHTADFAASRSMSSGMPIASARFSPYCRISFTYS